MSDEPLQPQPPIDPWTAHFTEPSEAWAATAPPRRTTPPDPNSWRGRVKRALAPLAAVGAALAKFGAVLIKLKVLVVIGSMAVSIAAYAWLWGWKFAVGFVALILVHELGHMVVLRARGIRSGWPVFLPFLGAFVSMQSAPQSVYQEAESALAGPLAGTAASLAVGYLAHVDGSSLLRSLAFVGLFLNLFNLLPALPLDGGRVAGALHPAIWLVGLLGLLGVEIYRPSPVIPILLVLGGFELYNRWRGRGSMASKDYLSLRPGQRAKIGTAYLSLVVVILIGMHLTYSARHF
ncbi:MAG TPA: site-2 protease family protein [Mycobacteriales bacterium]|nr:site-2 protease family protein [Mycobacteriales bacterium]